MILHSAYSWYCFLAIHYIANIREALFRFSKVNLEHEYIKWNRIVVAYRLRVTCLELAISVVESKETQVRDSLFSILNSGISGLEHNTCISITSNNGKSSSTQSYGAKEEYTRPITWPNQLSFISTFTQATNPSLLPEFGHHQSVVQCS